MLSELLAQRLPSADTVSEVYHYDWRHANTALALALGFLWQNGCLQQIAAKGVSIMSERHRDSAARLCSLSLADFVERYCGVGIEELQPWQLELIAGARDFKPTTAGVSRTTQKRERAALLSFFRESLGLFVCCRCGASFQSLPPPADTRPDDPNPMCTACLERALDEVEPEPISDEEIDSIVARVTGRTKEV
jgi:hypothetical protein